MDIKDIKDARVTHAGLLQHNADGSTDLQKITHAGLIARSPEGTAAKGMNIRGNEDLWVEIQANTFRNWVNEHLKDTDMQVNDWTTDFCDGTHLCALVEELQKRPLRPAWNRRPGNQHHFLENATVALNAIEKDGIKLVNIGNVDIVNGNVKLILGLIWSLIVRYQIGRSKFPPRKLMLAWLQAALPDCRINNLTTDWNSGVNLAALLDYCEPGLFPHWRTLDPQHSVRNCETAMNVALREFGVPKVLEPEYLASPWLDELSGMTYLSYFMKVGGPGYRATMRWVNGRLREPVTNFTSDWNDGRVLNELVRDLGGPAGDPDRLSRQPHSWETNITKAIDAGKQLGVTPILAAKDMANPEVEHLGIMSYAANLQWVTPRPPLANLLTVHLQSSSGRVGEPIYFTVEVLSRDVDLSQVRAFVVSPSGHSHAVRIGDNGQCSFVPDKYGMHEIVLEIDEQRLGGHFVRVLPRFVRVAPPGMAPCALGSLVEVLVNATGAPKTEDILVTAFSPTGRSLPCPLTNVGKEGHSAIFKPDEAGVWEIAITYQGEHIQGGPFSCSVFDPSGVSLHGLDGAMPLRAHSFEVDARGVGVPGELHVDIVHEKRSLVCSVERLQENKYRVTFMPRTNGKYRVYVYFNGYDVKGSPYIMRVGTKGRSGKTRSASREPSASREASPATASANRSSASVTKLNDFRTAKKELYAQDHRHTSPIPEEPTSLSSSSSLYKTKDYYSSNKRQETYSPQLRGTSVQLLRESSRSPQPEVLYSTSLKSPLARKPDEIDGRSRSPAPVSHLHSAQSKNYASNEKYVSTSSSQQKSSSYVPHALRESSPAGGRAGLHSPVTVTSTRYESSLRNVHSASPVPRRGDSASPAGGVSSQYITQSTHRVGSPSTVGYRSQPRRSLSPAANGSSAYRVSEESSSYQRTAKTTSNERSSPVVVSNGAGPSYFGGKPGGYDSVDNSPNIRVSKGQPGRRDSWDVINKTKHLLSHNSLESLANMTERQLNTDLSYSRPSVERDIETERNTRFNKYGLSASEKLGMETTRLHSISPVPTREPSAQRTYAHRIVPEDNHRQERQERVERQERIERQERQERVERQERIERQERQEHQERQHYVTTTTSTTSRRTQNNSISDDDYGYALGGRSATRFRPIEPDAVGARAIQVEDIQDGVLGRPVSFEIDGSRAGSGNLEILVNGGRVTSSVRALGAQHFVASFTPHETGRHTVQITFNDETVPGSPWHVDIMTPSGLSPLGESTRLVPAHSPAVFEVI